MKYCTLIVLLVWPILIQAFEDPALGVKASQYHRMIRGEEEAGAMAKEGGASTSTLLLRAERYARQKLWLDAIAEYEAIIARGDDSTAVWIALSEAWRNHRRHRQSRNRALQAAYAAYRGAQSSPSRARALFQLGSLYEQQQRPQQAMAVYREALALEENPEIRKRYNALVLATAFRAKAVEIESDSTSPRICLRFSAALSEHKQVRYEDYLRIEPTIKADVSVRQTRLCIAGVSHGERYQIHIRPGLPAALGERTRTAETFVARVDDRKPTAGFRGKTYVLPRAGSQGVPLTTVNVEEVDLSLLRINDRNLLRQINDRRIATTLDGYDVKAVIERSGERVWQGKMSVQSERNREVTTVIPMDELLERTAPGIYIITAQPSGKAGPRHGQRATQWLVVSNLGLSTFKGHDGLHVFVRSLEHASALSGVELRLYARNNSELGRAVTDANGHALFAPGLLRGDGGKEPAALMGYGADGDFNFLNLTRPSFDLSDRGVEGRAAPGPVDVFLYTERGVYRPGETIELMALARDDKGRALRDSPLVLKLLRPDGVEAHRFAVNTPWEGGYHGQWPLANNARTGTWKVRAYADPQAPPVGELSFQVEDFVPQRLRVELAVEAEMLKPSEALSVAVAGRFLYGAPAADLKTAAELVLREDPDPYPRYPDYRFGLVQESWKAKRSNLKIANTDAQGKTTVAVNVPQIPDTTRALKAVVRVSLFEPGGRPVNRSLSLPFRSQPFAIGIRPGFTDSLEPTDAAQFEVIVVNDQGRPQPRSGLRYEVLKEDYNYYWYFRNSHWNYKLVVDDGTPVASGELEVNGKQPRTLVQRGLDWGRYRLEIHDSATGIASSVRFQVGWFAGPGAEDAPDRLQLTLDKPRYQAGETAQVHVQAPFAGEVLMTVAANRLWHTQSFSLPPGGTTVELPVEPEWGPGVYVTATAFRPAQQESRRGPGRAVGVAWLGLDPEPRTLRIQLDTPAELKPRQTFELPVRVEGLRPGEPAYLTVAAVDEGILQLTDFPTPDPVAHFLGKRRLGVELLDMYGKLIETDGLPGRLRSGGDGDSRQLDVSAVRTVKTVALFSGPVALDESGRARVSLTLPDFNGELRLMAIAWDGDRVGREQAPLLVRDPLVARVYLPRFLAPGDRSDITLVVTNTHGGAGEYLVWLSAEGAVALEGSEVGFSFGDSDAAARKPRRRVYTLQALRPGTGEIRLRVEGPDGFNLSRDWQISVRPAQTIVSERVAGRLWPGDSLPVDARGLQSFLADTGVIRMSVATAPNLGIAGLLTELSRYPYGCLEQTTSQALALLYFNQVAQAWLDPGAEEGALRARVQGAIGSILNLQRLDGGFGLWNPDSPVEGWLSAYAMDFLVRAREAQYLVPTYAYDKGLEWLDKRIIGSRFESRALAAQSYGLHVLARAQRARIGDLRYLHDNYLARLPTRLARAQLGAALARYGDMTRARQAFTKALEPLRRHDDLRDYGSDLRDQAALLALLTESNVMPERVPQLAQELSLDLRQRRYTSTQEQVWLVLAARGLVRQQREPLQLAVDGKAVAAEDDTFHFNPSLEVLQRGVTITNQGKQPAWYVLHTSGVPAEPQPSVEAGFSISRRFFTRSGEEVDPTTIGQNDLLVVVITGEALTQQDHQALIVDLLPAGLEIENVRLAHNQSLDEFAWLPSLSKTLQVEFRSDRFVAALDLQSNGNQQGERSFAVAYLVRAVTPGDYRLPAVFVEDMYKPRYHARGKLERLKVAP